MSKPWAMGFCTSTTIMLHISKGIHKLILGQFMKLNCLKWFKLGLSQTSTFGPMYPSHPPYLSNCYIANWDNHVNARGDYLM